MEDQDNNEEFAMYTTSREDRYPMPKGTLGNVYIFNHITYDNDTLGVRYGNMKDSKDVEKAFRDLNFDVTIYNELNYKKIRETLSKLSEMDYSASGCVVIFVLTHAGRGGKIFAKDTDYYPDVFWKSFVGKNHSLAHKPKLIFIQANRGDEADDGVRVAPVLEVDASIPTTYPIPDIPDVLLMYSRHDGFYSWRSPVTGSWFVQCLCKELKLRAKETDILTLLTFLNGRMAMNNSGRYVPDNKTFNVTRQFGTIVSTLTKLLYFTPSNT